MKFSSVDNVKLVLEGVSKKFGGFQAVDSCTFAVEPGAFIGLVGPNGAGKTTIFNLICGVIAPDAGTISLGSTALTRRSTSQIARLGIGRTYQEVRIFKGISVEENILVYAAQAVRRSGWSAMTRRACRSEGVTEALEACGLTSQRTQTAGNLSYGEQKLLSLARIYALQPKIALLDEPLSGVGAHETERLLQSIHLLRDRGSAVVLIEHNLNAVRDNVHSVIFLDQGRVLAQGPTAEVLARPELAALYTGHEEN